MKAICQHLFNELHVYCRLCDLGIPKGISKSLAKLAGRITSNLYKEKGEKTVAKIYYFAIGLTGFIALSYLLT